MGKHAGLVTRLFFRLVMVAAAAGVAVLISWALAYNAVSNVLGAPPPDMGNTATVLLWQGATSLPGHPRAWRFTFGPTRVPNTPNARIYVSLLGGLLRTEPEDLPARLKAMHGKGFQ